MAIPNYMLPGAGLLSYRGQGSGGAAPTAATASQPAETLKNLLSPAISETPAQQIARAGGGLFGSLAKADVRTEAQKLEDQLKTMTLTDPEQQKAAIQLVAKFNPLAAIKLNETFNELAAQQAKTESDLATAELRKKQAQLADKDQEIAETAANAQMMNAEANKFRADNEAANWESEYQLDLDKIEAQNKRIDTDLQIATLNSEALKSADRARIQANVDASREQNKAVKSMRRIALAYEARKPLSGIAGKTQDKWEKFWGSQGEDAILRAQATQVINGAALQFLPPGAASDADINMVREGFLTAFDDPKAIAKFMRGMAKAAALESEYLKRKSAFMKENQGLSVGFDDQWEEISSSDDFISYMENKYDINIIENEAEQKAQDEQEQINFNDIPGPRQTARGSR